MTNAVDTSQQEKVRAAAELLARTSAGAVQEEGRTRYVQSETRGSKTPVVVDDVERPSCLIEVFAPRYEAVYEHLAVVGSPAVGACIAQWLSRMAETWQFLRLYEKAEALAIAEALLGEDNGV